MKCINCGNELPDNVKFCGVCGIEVKKLEENNNNFQPDNSNLVKEEAYSNVNNPLENINTEDANATTSSFVENEVNIPIYNNVNNQGNESTNVATSFNFNNEASDSNLNFQPTENENTINNIDFNSNQTEPATNNSISFDNNSNQNLESNFNDVIGPSVKPIDETNINSQNNIGSTFSNNLNNPVSNNNQKKSNKKITPIIVIVIIFIIAVGCVVGFLFLNKKNSPKEIFLDEVRNVTSKLLIDTNKSDYSNEIALKTNLKLPDAGYDDIIDIINKIDLTYSNSYSEAKKAMDNIVKLRYDGKDLFNIGAYYRNDKLYLDLGDLYSKMIAIPTEEYNIKELMEIDAKTKKNLETIKTSVDSAFEKAMKDSYFKATKQSITVDGKSKKVTANTMELSGKELGGFVKDIMTYLRNDDKFLTAVAEMSEMKKEDIKEELNVENEELDIDATLSMTIYTSGLLKKSCDGFAINVKAEGTDFSVSILKASDKKYEISLSSSGVTITGTITKEVIKDTTKYSFNMNLGTTSIGFDMSVKESATANLKTIDETKTVTLEEFSSTGMTEIMTNIQKNEAFLKLYEQIEKTVRSTYDNSTYSGNYNFNTTIDSLDDYGTDYNSLSNIYNSI